MILTIVISIVYQVQVTASSDGDIVLDAVSVPIAVVTHTWGRCLVQAFLMDDSEMALQLCVCTNVKFCLANLLHL